MLQIARKDFRSIGFPHDKHDSSFLIGFEHSQRLGAVDIDGMCCFVFNGDVFVLFFIQTSQTQPF